VAVEIIAEGLSSSLAGLLTGFGGLAISRKCQNYKA
jgi:hypothetical protein